MSDRMGTYTVLLVYDETATVVTEHDVTADEAEQLAVDTIDYDADLHRVEVWEGPVENCPEV